MIYNRFFYKLRILKRSEQRSQNALHIILPHCANWPLTLTSIDTFEKLTVRDFSITVVNNFDLQPPPQELWTKPKLTLIEHRLTRAGAFLLRLRPKRHGSIENALALDAALHAEPHFNWAFMAHSDSAPLIKGWDDFFFAAKKESKIIGNYRDLTRIHAAHASGTLFDQQTFLSLKASMQPEYHAGMQRLDVGDRATEVLHDRKCGPVAVLPNTINEGRLIETLEKKQPLLASFAKDGSAISLDASASFAVFGHLGRGTPRSLNDPKFAQKLPQQVWIEHLRSIVSSSDGGPT